MYFDLLFTYYLFINIHSVISCISELINIQIKYFIIETIHFLEFKFKNLFPEIIYEFKFISFGLFKSFI